MILFRKFKIEAHERGLLFNGKRFVTLLPEGEHAVFDPLRKLRVEIVNLRNVFFKHAELDVLARKLSAFEGVEIVELTDHQRAFVFVDGRFERILGPGLHVLWKGLDRGGISALGARQTNRT